MLTLQRRIRTSAARGSLSFAKPSIASWRRLSRLTTSIRTGTAAGPNLDALRRILAHDRQRRLVFETQRGPFQWTRQGGNRPVTYERILVKQQRPAGRCRSTAQRNATGLMPWLGKDKATGLTNSELPSAPPAQARPAMRLPSRQYHCRRLGHGRSLKGDAGYGVEDKRSGGRGVHGSSL